jgi:probable HAF family extracellular repeat protein
MKNMNARYGISQSVVLLSLLAMAGTAAQADPVTITSSYAFGVNNSDQIVGSYADSLGYEHGYLLSGGQTITLDDPAAHPEPDPTAPFYGTEATAINDSGQIVGFYYNNTGTQYMHGFLYSVVTGKYTTIMVPNSVTTFAYGINDNGQIVGTYIDASNHYSGFLYTISTGQYTTFTVPGAPSVTEAVGINNQGQIVGDYVDSSGNVYGYQYSLSTGHYTTISDPNAAPADGGTTAHAISTSGQIVGNFVDSNTINNGFSYTSGGGFQTINDPMGTSTSLFGISASGQYIVGSYFDANTAFSYTGGVFTTLDITISSVPEPSSLVSGLIASLAGLGVLVRRRARSGSTSTDC